MKRFAGMMGALLLVPTLALASGDMVSVSELRQQAEAMGRWTQTYEAHGRTIEVDIPIYIPNEKELAVYDCSAYTEYIKNPNSDDKNNVYSYNENLRELTKEKDGTSEADIEVYGKGTELRIMLNNPEDLLGKNKNDNIKIKEYGFYQYQVDDKVTYAENNEMSLEEAEKYLEEIVEYSKEEIAVNPWDDDFRRGFSFKELVFDGRTGEKQKNVLNNRTDYFLPQL